MKTNKTTAVPRLRFPDFKSDEDWKVSALDDIATFHKGKGVSKSDISDDGKQPCIRYGELYTHYEELIDEIKSFTDITADNLVLSQANDVIIPASGETQEDISTASCVTNKDVALGGDLNIIRSNLNGVFLSYYLNSAKKTEISKLAQGVSVVHLYSSQLKKLSIAYPEPKEQQKIADCLSSLDILIKAENEQLDILKEYKAGLLQQLFPAEGETTPRRRFSELRDGGDWSTYNLNKVAKLNKERNKNERVTRVFTNSAIDGIVDQKDYFKKNIANQSNLGNYYIVNKNDFIYNPRISVNAPVGPISRNKIGEGVMSPLYTVFSFAKGVSSFYEYYFQTTHWHRYLKQVSNMGARHDRMNIAVDDFKKIPLPYPDIIEQQKIADCLSSLDSSIKCQDNKVEALKQHKQGLMQQLFPTKYK